MMDGKGKPDRPEVPAKFPNRDGTRKPPGCGGPYTGSKAERLDTAKGRSTGLAAEADGSWLLALGSWLLALGSWLLALGSWLLALGSWLLALGSWLLALGSWLSL